MKKKKLFFMILIIIVVLIGIAFGAYYFFKYPMKLICQAIDDEDIEQVVSIYPSVRISSDREYVQSEMMRYAQCASEEYLDNDISYDEIMKNYNLIKQDILSGNPEFMRCIELVETIESSRKAFSSGVDYMDGKEYDNAVISFSGVIEADEANYDEAQNKIEFCNLMIASYNAYDAGIDEMEAENYQVAIDWFDQVSELDEENYENACKYKEDCLAALMTPADSVVGKWVGQVDIGEYALSMLGFSEYEITLPVNILVILDDNGEGEMTVYVDENGRQAFVESLKEPISVELANQYGVGQSGLSLALGMLGTTLEEEIDNNIDSYLAGTEYEDIFGNGYSLVFEYSYDENTIYEGDAPFFSYELDDYSMSVNYIGNIEEYGAILPDEIVLMHMND